MTNGEKYKTDCERKDAFALFCAKRWCTTIEREKRVQEVALQLVARTSANVACAFKLAEEYVAECERRENKIKDGGE